MKQRASVLLLSVLGVLLMAPTVGDTGGCGRTATDLDRERYTYARKREDCRHCAECDLSTPRCQRACDSNALPDILLPATCRPLYHDGEVCLRAVMAADCETFATFVDETAPVNPSECDFCRLADPSASFDSGLP